MIREAKRRKKGKPKRMEKEVKREKEKKEC